MAYRFQPQGHVPDELRRCAREQLDRAIVQLTDRVSDDPVKAVHDARKALKQERSLLRLARGTMTRAERRRENAALRHAGRMLSGTRDAEVMLQALDRLAERFAGQLPQSTFDAIRGPLTAERDQARQRLLESGLAGAVAAELRTVRSRVEGWSLKGEGWKALEPGLHRSYRRGRRALRRAGSRPTVASLHEWRKRTKDLWYHLRLLKASAPGIVGGYADDAHALSDVLGDDHDLALLNEVLRSRAGELAVDLDAVIELIDHRREQLQADAMRLGERVYAERPKPLSRRLRRYWKAARVAAGPPPAALHA
jgi:CHAD domain-containing protein